MVCGVVYSVVVVCAMDTNMSPAMGGGRRIIIIPIIVHVTHINDHPIYRTGYIVNMVIDSLGTGW